MSAPNPSSLALPLHQIVIVGGGAGGLVLATRLGDTLGKRRQAQITLVDMSRTHLWKPLLHEVAAGSLGVEDQALDYMAQSRWHHFEFRLGAIAGLDRGLKEIYLAPVLDREGEVLIPRRTVQYDTLVIAIGSVTSDMEIPGVPEHCFRLDAQDTAARFHEELVNACIRAQVQETALRPGQLHVAIVGGGATGIELAAELRNTTRELASYGFHNIDPEHDIHLTIVEAAPALLPSMPAEVSEAVKHQLSMLGVTLRLNERVTHVENHRLHTESGGVIDAELIVWAAGIKAPDCQQQFDGLETNWMNQLVVRPTLQTTRDEDIFAFGDCAACPITSSKEGDLVPPRAQAAQQQANLLIISMKHRLSGKRLPLYHYNDFGTLITLGKLTAVGKLMGGVRGEEMFVHGAIARFMFRLLYKAHLASIHGYTKVLLDSVAELIASRTESHVKLH